MKLENQDKVSGKLKSIEKGRALFKSSYADLTIPLERDPGYQIFEYACHEGNHAVENVLSGGRAQDKLAEKGSK